MSLFDWVNAGTQLYGAYQGSKAAKDAAKQQQQAASQAIAQQRPYAKLGDYSANQLQQRLTPNALLDTFSMADLENDPGYQFELQEGQRAIDKAHGAAGKRYSGQTLKAATKYGQGLAATRFNDAYNRDANDKSRIYNMLAGGVNAGQGSSGVIGNYLVNAGDAGAAGRIGSSNAWNDALSNIGQIISDYQDRRQINRLMV